MIFFDLLKGALPGLFNLFRRTTAVIPTINTPRLNFVREGNVWKIKNTGGIPAEKIRFGQIDFIDETQEHNFKAIPWLYYTLEPYSQLLLSGIKYQSSVIDHPHVLVATYTDYKNNEYITYCRTDTNHVFIRSRFWGWRGISMSVSKKELNRIHEHLHKRLNTRSDWVVINR